MTDTARTMRTLLLIGFMCAALLATSSCSAS